MTTEVSEEPGATQAPQPLRRVKSAGHPDANKAKTPGASNTTHAPKRSSEIIKSATIKIGNDVTPLASDITSTLTTSATIETPDGNNKKHVHFEETVIIKEPTHLTANDPASLSANFTDDIESVDGNSDDERQDKMTPLPSVRRRPASARSSRNRSKRSKRRHSARMASTGIKAPSSRTGRQGSKTGNKRRNSVSVPRSRKAAQTSNNNNNNNKLSVPKTPTLANSKSNNTTTTSTPSTPDMTTPNSPMTPVTPLTPNSTNITPKLTQTASNSIKSPRINRTNNNTTTNSSRRRNSSHTTRDIDNEALITRLRRENQEYKKKLKTLNKDISSLRLENMKYKNETDTLRQSLKNPNNNNNSNETNQKILNKLKKELKDTKHELLELRQLNKEYEIKLQSSQDKLQLIEKSNGNNELFAQLQRMKKDAKNARKEKNQLRDEAIKLKNIDANLRSKLARLMRKLMDIDDKIAKQVGDATDIDSMLNVLIEQLIIMTSKYETLLRELDIRIQHEVKDKTNDLEITVKAKDKIIESLKIKLRETDDMYEENKKIRREIADKNDELELMRAEREKVQLNLVQEQEKSKNFEKQVKIISHMPGDTHWNKQVSRLKKLFIRLDINKDGHLDFEEFRIGAEELGFGSFEYEQKASFDDMDNNGDGLIEYEDFQESCMKILHNKENVSKSEWLTMRTLLTKPPLHWSNEDVINWLSHIGLEQYHQLFENKNIDGKKLLNISKKSSDIKTLSFELEHYGITKNRHIKKIQKELNDIKNRDEIISNMRCEIEKLKDELDIKNEELQYGPSWKNVKTLQSRVRGLELQLRHERAVREQIMFEIKDELRNDPRFDNLDVNKEDMVAELALLKGALADSNYQLQQLRKAVKNGEYTNSSDNDGNNNDFSDFKTFFSKTKDNKHNKDNINNDTNDINNTFEGNKSFISKTAENKGKRSDNFDNNNNSPSKGNFEGNKTFMSKTIDNGHKDTTYTKTDDINDITVNTGSSDNVDTSTFLSKTWDNSNNGELVDVTGNVDTTNNTNDPSTADKLEIGETKDSNNNKGENVENIDDIARPMETSSVNAQDIPETKDIEESHQLDSSNNNNNIDEENDFAPEMSLYEASVNLTSRRDSLASIGILNPNSNIFEEEEHEKERPEPIGRFLQKWYVLANHNTQYWISRTNRELLIQEELYKKENELSGLSKTSNMSEEEALEQGKSLEITETLNWILYDAKRDRLINEVRMRGRGMKNDPKNVRIQMSIDKGGPWTTVADAELQKTNNEQCIGGFRASSRYWRVCLMTNHGEINLDAPKFCMYEVQFWGPLDDDIENKHFIIE